MTHCFYYYHRMWDTHTFLARLSQRAFVVLTYLSAQLATNLVFASLIYHLVTIPANKKLELKVIPSKKNEQTKQFFL